MKNKGTGWIPDYPDINDYTLQSEGIQNLTSRIQSQKETGSIESLAMKVSKALTILANQQDQPQHDKNQLIQLRNDLEQNVLGENSRFVTVKLHNVFKENMSDSEVLLIKNYLQRILWTWKLDSSDQVKHVISDMKLNDTTFDDKTSNILNRVLKTQERLIDTIDGSIGKDDMEAIKELADLSIIIDSPSYLKNLPNKWQKWSDFLMKKEVFENLKYGDFQKGQIKLIVHLFNLLKKIQGDNDNIDSINVAYMYEIQKTKEIQNNVNQTIKYLNIYKADMVNGLLCITRNGKRLIEENEGESKKLNSVALVALAEITTKYAPAIGICDDENETWINKYIEDLDEVLEELNKLLKLVLSLNNTPNLAINSGIPETDDKYDQEIINKRDQINKKAADIKAGIEEKISEWQKFMKTVYQIVPPQIPPQPLGETKISIQPPIPSKVRKLLKTKLITEKSSVSQPNTKIKLPIYSIIELISQTLMPLAKHANLSQAVEQVINKMQASIDKDDKEKTKDLIRETVEEYNFRSFNDFNLLEEIDFFKIMLVVIIQELDCQVQADNQSNQSSEEVIQEKKPTTFRDQLNKILQDSKNTSPLIYKLLNKLKDYEDSQLEELRKLARVKKPLLEIQNAQQIISNDLSCKLCEEADNSLQLPINSQLRGRLREALGIDSQNNHKKDEDQTVKEEQKRIFLLLPEFVDLSYWCSPIEDQGTINSCTAHAGIALMEYAEKKSSGNYTDASPLFLYKATRNLMQREGDSGASVRDTMKAMVAFGVCPENYWSYDEDKFDEEPTPFCYSFAENYKALKYFRIDYGRISKYALLSQIKVLLAAELPCIFGFTLYKSVYNEANTAKGYIPLPNEQDRVIGGHTVVAVGYHDRKIVENADGMRSEGALLIRNSWGTRWGEGGYGWLPYDYIVKGLTADWWSLLKAEWLSSGRFGAGASAWSTDRGGNRDDPGGQT